MAYPQVVAPYGLRPINSVDGKPYAGATRQLKIAALAPGGVTAADSIFYGDVVAFKVIPDSLTGYRVTRWDNSAYSGNTISAPVGVFMGCTYTNPVTKQPTWSQYWPGPAAAPDAMAYIVDDPMALFKVTVTDFEGEGPDAMAVAQYWAIGMNMAINQDYNGVDGNTNSGDSYMSALLSSLGSGSGYNRVLRVIDVVPDTKTETGYPELLVKFNFPHAYDNSTGVDAPLLT